MPAVLSVAPRRPSAPLPAPRPGADVVIVDDVHGLTEHVGAWQSLAAAALEPNVFLEPCLFLPAVYAFGVRGLRFVLVYATFADGRRSLAGFFPIERRFPCRGLPISCVRLWRHQHCYLGTPLVHAEHASLALAALFEWAADTASLVEMPLVAADGPFAKRLSELARPALITACQERAVLRPGRDAGGYLHATLSGSTRRALKRRHKRFAETGTVTVETAEDDTRTTAWVEDFLRLEASGWKGRLGTALAANGADTVFFRMAAHAAARAGRLLRLTLCLDGRPIAARCSFRSGPAAFSFKSAYDEAFAAHSPGVLLELENVRHCHALAGLEWMDSCTRPDNDLINRLWHDRRSLQTVTLATGPRGEMFVRLLRSLQALRHRSARQEKSS